MKLSTFLITVFAAAAVAEPCTSKAPVSTPTERVEMCTKICAFRPIQDCGRGGYTKQQGKCWSCCKK
ncbi:uncharacterized protein EKO05_0000087 [Ascochyta rabiei]|uniref:Uncharacterized protein n=1 Tax=Didymella rabiei TaxID=5454 RepID=A0A163CEX7_DIDRA|nr:uncharacterized protein EKO05_0000087 [Ascochyta rabiei]KZM22412.1 hypothetical protein ST47_g6454 [Ascochyta rabiei]UPX09397.1 hypothetical protein EKO05_0000087 [Ascochyta rabiei]